MKFRRKEKLSEIPRNNIGKLRNFGTESNTTADKTWKKDFDIRDWSFNDWTIKFGAAGNNFSNSFQQTIPKKKTEQYFERALAKKKHCLGLLKKNWASRPDAVLVEMVAIVVFLLLEIVGFCFCGKLLEIVGLLR